MNRKEKKRLPFGTPFGLNSMKSQVLYRAAQGHHCLLTKPGTIGATNVKEMGRVTVLQSNTGQLEVARELDVAPKPLY